MGPIKCDQDKQLRTLTVITLSDFNCIIKKYQFFKDRSLAIITSIRSGGPPPPPGVGGGGGGGELVAS
jgi:hypothetical protein